MTDAEWQLKERELERAVRASAKAITLSKGSLAEKLRLVEIRNEARETLRQHRLNRFKS